MQVNILVNMAAARTIEAMSHSAGTAELYIETLDRIFNAVLYNQDSLGMDDTEAMATLQTIGLLTRDLQDIRGSNFAVSSIEADPEEADDEEDTEPEPEETQRDNNITE